MQNNTSSSATRITSMGARAVVIAVAVALVLTLAGTKADAAPATHAVTSAVQAGSTPASSTTATPEVQAPIKVLPPTAATPAKAASSGCVGLLSARQWQVLVFALAYCPTTWVLQYTSWGRGIVNWVVNILCRQPWIVRAATGGRYSTC